MAVFGTTHQETTRIYGLQILESGQIQMIHGIKNFLWHDFISAGVPSP
jgi:hypothetical protein